MSGYAKVDSRSVRAKHEIARRNLPPQKRQPKTAQKVTADIILPAITTAPMHMAATVVRHTARTAAIAAIVKRIVQRKPKAAVTSSAATKAANPERHTPQMEATEAATMSRHAGPWLAHD